MDLDELPEDAAAATVVSALALLTAPPVRRRLRRVAVTGLALGLEMGGRLGGVGQGLRARLWPGSPTEDELEDIVWPPRSSA